MCQFLYSEKKISMIFFSTKSPHFWLHCGFVRTLAPTIGYLSYIWRRKECQHCIPFLHHHYFGKYILLEFTSTPSNPESIGEKGIFSQYSGYEVFQVLHSNLFMPGPCFLCHFHSCGVSKKS